MRIRFELWNNGDRQCPTARQRGWHVIEELQRRGYDADAWDRDKPTKTDVLVIQRAIVPVNLERALEQAEHVWLDVNDDYLTPGRNMGFDVETLPQYHGLLAGSEWLAVKLAREHPRVRLWREAVDPAYSSQQCAYSRRSRKVRVAWMGGTDNLRWFGLSPLRWVLPDFADRLHWVVAAPALSAKGADNAALAKELLPGEVEFHPWTYETVGPLMASCDMSIIALEQTEWCWSKSDNKPASMMTMGLPVATEDIECYREIGEGGYAATAYQAEDWAEVLEKLIGEPTWRRRLGRKGQAWARRERSIERVTDMFLDAIAKEGTHEDTVGQTPVRTAAGQ